MKLINVKFLEKNKMYINRNTGTSFIFDKHEKTEKNLFAVDTNVMIHICQNFKTIEKNELDNRESDN